MKYPIKVSTIIPAYNAESFIGTCLDAVLAQTETSAECIVVNDGSTDGTRECLEPYLSRITYLEQENKGVSAARNLAIQHARGRYLTLVDADDIVPENRFEKMLTALETTDADMVFGHMRQFEEHAPSVFSELQPAVMPGGSMFSREVFDRVGPFDPALKLAEFLDWLLKFREQGFKELIIPDVVLYRRIHSDNIGTRMKESRVDYVRALKASMDRKRARKSNSPESSG
ncbi:glycosyltransferase family A protein [Kiritimatiellota bacterium B12222]|nr:glycosyltransferase family A protein [Kiritimatiellota bacterium B12222]